MDKSRFTIIHMEKDMQVMIITIALINSKDCHSGTEYLGTISEVLRWPAFIIYTSLWFLKISKQTWISVTCLGEPTASWGGWIQIYFCPPLYNQAVTPTLPAVPNIISLLEQIQALTSGLQLLAWQMLFHSVPISKAHKV